ncbi:MAG: thermonuclease family protein [Desulfobacterales bacterium]|jgi:endonuclease YncB( thermonuclease family)
MSNILRSIISFSLFSILFFIPASSLAEQFIIIRVYDGDTVIVSENGRETTIRLVGIDAPEISTKQHLPGQPFSIKAKEHLAAFVLNKKVHIKLYGKDASGKWLGEIFLENVNINIRMIHAGLAEVYRGTLPQNLEINAYRIAERKAKENFKGIWELRDQYFSPWHWREMHSLKEPP